SLEIRSSLDNVAAPAALCIYRITQEALRNVARHAGVAAAAVEVEQADGWIRLAISDAGVGMDPEGQGASAGLGLVSIKERARLVGGNVEIRSAPNQGTTIAVRIPILG